MHPGVYVSNTLRTEPDLMAKLNEIESALKLQLAKIADIKLSLLNTVSAESKMPAGIVGGKRLMNRLDIGRNMNEEY